MWEPPWPPIQISDCEWVIVRDDPRRPAGLIRRIDTDPPHFRVVTWAERSEDRRLIGRFTSLAAADRSLKFRVPEGSGPGPFQGYPKWVPLHPWHLITQVERHRG